MSVPHDSSSGGARAIVEGFSFSERPTLTEGLRLKINSGDVPAQAAVLLRTDRRGCGQLVSLPFEVTRLGRSFEAEAHIDDEAVSRFHAEVRAEAGGFVIADLGSRNGTYVDDRRVESAELRDGCVIRLGARVSFRFSVVEEDEKQALSCLHELGHHDPLTRVYNRRYLSQRLVAELAFAERHRTSVSIILFDLDRFKAINDQHGHQAGDQVLEHVAAVAAGQVRTEDVVARYGGEEFMIVLRGTPVSGAEILAERIRRVVADSPVHTGSGAPLRVTLSAGCASLECAGSVRPEDLIRVADRRLYVAKHEGRNRVVGSGFRSSVNVRPSSAAPRPSMRLVAAAMEDEPDSRIQRISRLAAAFERLPKELRTVVGLHLQEHCGFAEIAAILNTSEERVRSQYDTAMRALDKLRA